MPHHLFRRILNASFSAFNKRYTQSIAHKTVLGIETSCDETGAAIIDEYGKILGEALSSQMQVHLDNGGVIPHLASYLHQKNIENVVNSALQQSKLNLLQISAIAATTKPGLKSSLTVGLEYGKQLAKEFNKPFIPVHHMEAHSLTIRMIEDISFPFLVLLASGGHCQIAVVNSVSQFLLLGTSEHNSPGELLDKIARRLKLQNIPECYHMSGGQAIEFMAKNGNPLAYEFPRPLLAHRNCNFSFSGFGSYALVQIEKEEKLHDIAADGVIPNVEDFCASLLHGYALHMIHRVHRAFLFCDLKGLLPKENKVLVFSGGVACNSYIRSIMQRFCESLNARLACPPRKLCTDNGIMIAWNGMEKLKEGIELFYGDDINSIEPISDCPLGIDMTSEVRKASIKVKFPKIEINSNHYAEAVT